MAGGQVAYDIETWNAAIDAAVKAIYDAPVFTKADRGAQLDAECLRVLGVCGQQVRNLRK